MESNHRDGPAHHKNSFKAHSFILCLLTSFVMSKFAPLSSRHFKTTSLPLTDAL